MAEGFFANNHQAVTNTLRNQILPSSYQIQVYHQQHQQLQQPRQQQLLMFNRHLPL